MRLLLGCSFAKAMHRSEHIKTKLAGNSTLISIASPGAGNDWISAALIDAVNKYKREIEYALILWSGISRLDLEINHSDITELSDYVYTRDNFIHSGGVLQSWQFITDRPIHRYIEHYYRYQCSRLDTARTIRNMFAAKCALEAYNISYDFGMIYDADNIHNPHEHTLGIASESLADYYNISTFPYDWCEERNLIDEDGFHPLEDGFNQWYNSLDLKI